MKTCIVICISIMGIKVFYVGMILFLLVGCSACREKQTSLDQQGGAVLAYCLGQGKDFVTGYHRGY